MKPLPYPWENRLEEEPWRVQDKAEWERLEAARLDNARRKTDKTYAAATFPDQVQQQMAFVHESHLQVQPCWLCDYGVMGYFAAGSAKKRHVDPYRCIRCRVRMTYVVPLIIEHSWRWGRPKDISTDEIRIALMAWDEHLGDAHD